MTHKISIIGFGSQAQAWAHNLSFENREIDILLRSDSPSTQKVKDAGYQPQLLSAQTLQNSDIIALLIPDHLHDAFLCENAQHLRPKTLIILAHGHSFFAHDFLKKFPDLHFALLAPKGIASELIKRKKAKLPIGGVWDLQAKSQTELSTQEEVIKKIAVELGLTHLYKSSFKEEMKADLLSEQSLLCGLIPYAAKKTFDKMREAGISKELAFMECWMELQMITNALVSNGPEGFFNLISPNALFGSQKAQDKFSTLTYDKALDELWADIDKGEFTQACQNYSFDKAITDTQKEWKTSQLQETYEQLKGLVQQEKN